MVHDGHFFGFANRDVQRFVRVSHEVHHEMEVGEYLEYVDDLDPAGGPVGGCPS
ncbi:MAG: hypothetical protein BWY71_01828 [Planctomycetes bacterium ADurb.Bin412]|nr:MAG: hypothetical protein BWY71_01828 [Planctomycetes bacterium ADurb.Bin412]